MAGLDPAISADVAHAFVVGESRTMREAWDYMMTNRRHGVLYVEVTSHMARRAWEHRDGIVLGFTSRYRLKRLVWVERHATILSAIQREKNIKHWPRAWKIALIKATNPEWHDLYDQIL
jgi:putative endonuclease